MTFRRRLRSSALVFGIVLLALPQAYAQLPVVCIGQISDGAWDREDPIRRIFEAEILELMHREFDVRFPPEKRISTDWRMDNTTEALDRLLADPEVDLIIAGGVLASYEASRRERFQKPVIAPYVVDADIQGILTSEGTSGIKNLCYVSFPSPTRADLSAFQSIVPFTRFAVLMNRPYFEMMPELMDRLTSRFLEEGLDPVIIPVGESADDALAALPADIQAVYLTPLIQLSAKEFSKLVNGMIQRKLPSYSYLGRDEVEMGIMAGSQLDFFPKIARRVALNVQRILLGEDAGSIPAALSPNTQLTINMATARAIGVSPSWGVVTEAELIQQEREDITRKLDLQTVVQEALAANVELAAKGRLVAASAQNIREARASLLPQMTLSGLGMVIDDDRAEASMGQQPERTVSGSIGATQLLYSEPAWANLSIQKDLHKARESEWQQLRLDIMQAAATGFLNVLRAQTFERIQKENLKRTRSNLELARVREVVGSAGPAEVHRWESQMASNRKTVIEANAQRNLAEMELNRLLHRPSEEAFLTVEPDLDAAALTSAQGVYARYFGDKHSFRIFRAFLVQEGLNASPELAQLDAAIASQKRALRSATRRFWSPTIALRGGMDHTFSREGEGSEPFPGMDDTNWSVGLSASLPLFEGASKFAARRKATETLAQLRLERQALAERIEQRTRAAAHVAGASHAGIGQTLEAAQAASKSLDVVRDAYSRGVVSVVDLLDAQNAALVSDLAAADAFYTFLIDLVAVGRAVGLSGFAADDRAAFFQRAEGYFSRLE